MGLRRSRSLSCALIGSASINPDPTPLTRTHSIPQLPNYRPFWANYHSYWNKQYPRGAYSDYRPNPQTSYYGVENHTQWFTPRPYYTVNTDTFLAAIRRTNPYRNYVHHTSYRDVNYTPLISKSYYSEPRSYYWPARSYNYDYVYY
ncbi:unnamed protein product [Bursaphelenchus xylophilus]|uniref:(pine wood nematode) hypothetical protein n=1 Tax=Bursaphelenchus xylophilus TaxID=6326 RepID=A0A1I7STA6_BURXY|nr:unnamed protein product [Bursaphelenchus xylophilus]CAG9108609.1 unnamed protein product [Bursaphelenchus xylophilus]